MAKKDEKDEAPSNPAVDAHKADKHDEPEDMPAAPAHDNEPERPNLAPEVEVNMDPDPHPDPTTVEEIDAILRNPNFDPSGVERKRLAELSRRISAKKPAESAGVFDQSISR